MCKKVYHIACITLDKWILHSIFMRACTSLSEIGEDLPLIQNKLSASYCELRTLTNARHSHLLKYKCNQYKTKKLSYTLILCNIYTKFLWY